MQVLQQALVQLQLADQAWAAPLPGLLDVTVVEHELALAPVYKALAVAYPVLSHLADQSKWCRDVKNVAFCVVEEGKKVRGVCSGVVRVPGLDSVPSNRSDSCCLVLHWCRLRMIC